MINYDDKKRILESLEDILYDELEVVREYRYDEHFQIEGRSNVMGRILTEMVEEDN